MPNGPTSTDVGVIAAGLSGIDRKSEKDAEDIREEKAQQQVADDLYTEVIRARVKDMESQRKLREDYAGKVITFLKFYAAGAAVLILMDAVSVPSVTWLSIDLPENVLLAIILSMTASVIGLVGFVVRGLFRVPRTDLSQRWGDRSVAALKALPRE